MLALLILQALGQTVAPQIVPTDWSKLAPLPYATAPQITPPLTQFVADEIAAGRCARPKSPDGKTTITVDVATYVGVDGVIRRTVPRAIDCPTVEQYSAGLVLSFARTNLLARTVVDHWYRATIVYELGG